MGETKIQGAKVAEAKIVPQKARQITVMGKFECTKIEGHGTGVEHDCAEEVAGFVNERLPDLFDSYTCSVMDRNTHLLLSCIGTPQKNFVAKTWTDAVSAYKAAVYQKIVAETRQNFPHSFDDEPPYPSTGWE